MNIVKGLIGDIQWTPPDWASRLGVKRIVFLILAALALAFALHAFYTYYESRPKPPHVVARVTTPALTPVINNELAPQPLMIDFQVVADPGMPIETIDSVARIDLLDKPIDTGIEIKPGIAGTWKWVNETRLQFQPAVDWPAGQEYRVTYDTSIFADNLEFQETKVSFTTPAFTVSLNDMAFYQDPLESDLRKVVATLSFSHPVDKSSLTEHLQLSMRAASAAITTAATPHNYTLSFENFDRTVYVHSEKLEIPAHEAYMALTLDKDVKPVNGPARTLQKITKSVSVPDIESYFKVSNTNSLLVRNDDNDPIQTITIEFTDRVKTQLLQKQIRAYVLPVDVTIQGSVQSRKHWSSPRQISPEVLAQAKEIDVQLNPVEHDAAALHSFRMNTDQERSIYLQVNSGLQSMGGFVMRSQFDTILRSSAYPKEVTIAQDGALLPLTGSHRLTFVSRGVNTLKVEIGRLINNEVNHLASQIYGDFSNPNFKTYAFNEDNLVERTTRYIDLNAGPPNQATYSNLDLSDFLLDGGYYFITVQGWDRGSNRAQGQEDKRFVLITDLGLLVKSNADSTQDVFVHSLSNGLPVAGASVELLGKNGVAVISRNTDQNGHASIPATNSFEREKQATVFIVRQGQDSVFMPYRQSSRQLQYSRFDVGGDYMQRRDSAERIKAQLFTERDLYRPGDTTYLAAIVKRDDWLPLDQLPLLFRITDPRGQNVMEKRFKLPADGFLEEQFATDVSSPTGSYIATLLLIDERGRKRAIGSHTFKVEEFQPDRLRIRTTISGQQAKGWLKPANLTSEVVLENLFGTAAEDRRVKGDYELIPSSIFFGDYKDYTFIDPLRLSGSVIRPVAQALPEVRTDAFGKAVLPLPLAQYDKGIYKLNVFTEGFEQGGGRSVKSQASVMLSALNQLIGYKTSGDFGFVKKNSKHTINFIALNSSAENIGLQQLQLSIVEQRFVSTLVQRANGTYAYQSVEKEYPLSSEPFSIAKNGTEYALPTATPGRYSITLQDDQGLVYSKVPYVVAGARNLAGNLEKNAELDLSLNGSNFKPGDYIEMEITAPYTGSGLITIERERVLNHIWFKADTTTTLQRIQVPDDLEGNAYVNVSFVRDLGSPEVFISPLSYAVKPFSVNRDARTVKLELSTPELVKPGQDLTIAYTASVPSRVVVYAVDEGILQVAKYKLPDPLEFFLRKMALQVDTFQLLDLILPEFESYRRAAAPGGGEAAGLLGKNLNPFRRKTDAPVVYWSGIVEAGPQSKSLNYQVPDSFNGQLRIMAVAVSPRAVGNAKTSALVRAPFVITPNLLTAAAPGDEFDVNVGVANTLEGSGPGTSITLSAQPSEHLEIVGDTSQVLIIDEGRESRARFRIRAKAKLGAAHIQFGAVSETESAQMRATVSVRPSVPYVATMQAGSSRADPVSLKFARSMHDEFAQQSSAASASPLILADGLLAYLDAFPHACAEQLVSKVFPQLGFLQTGDRTIDQQKIRDGFALTVQKLRARQTSTGGFRFWPTSSSEQDFATVYIMHFFSDAAELGLAVPRDMVNSGQEYLRTLAAGQVNSLAQAQVRAYAIYVLTRYGIVSSNYLTNLHEYLEAKHPDTWRHSLTAVYMAGSYQLLKIPKLGDQLMGEYKMQAGDEMNNDFDTRLGRDAQYVYIMSKHFPLRLNSLDPDAIQALVAPIMKNRFNTLSSAYTIMALNAFSQALFDKNGAVNLSILAVDGNASKQLVVAAVFARAQVKNQVREVQIAGSNKQDIYYVMSQTGFNLQPPDAVQKEGLEIFREYLDDKGNAVTKAKVGTELTVQMRVRSTGAIRSNVAVIDMLPGGFEVITESVRDSYGQWRSDYLDVREDRVVIYGSFDDRITTISYRVKLTSSGSFVLPAAYAGSMYDRSVQAHTKPGRFEVSSVQ